MGDRPGHEFHGNQWTDAFRGPGGPGVGAPHGDWREPHDPQDPRPEEPSKPVNPASWERVNTIRDTQARYNKGEIFEDEALRGIREQKAVLQEEHGLDVQSNTFGMLHAATPADRITQSPVDREVAEALFHAQLAALPEGVLDHLRTNGYVVKADPSEKVFNVGGKSFNEAGHVSYENHEVVFRPNSVTPDGRIDPNVVDHEFGHVGMEVLVGRYTAAMVVAHGQKKDALLENGYPDTAEATKAWKYKEKLGKALANFESAYREEGGVSDYAKSYRNSPWWDRFVATGEGYHIEVASNSISRGANENFAELMSKFRFYSQDTHSASVKMYHSNLKEMMPKTAGAFKVLASEIGRKAPTWARKIKIVGGLG